MTAMVIAVVAVALVFGSAAARHSATVQWRVAARVATAWLLTLPGAALVGAFARQTAREYPAGNHQETR